MRIPRTNYFISQVLPGGGTFLVGGTFEFPWGTNVITFYITYTRGAANGQSRPATRSSQLVSAMLRPCSNRNARTVALRRAPQVF